MRKNCQLQSGMVWALICPSHAARFCFSVSESGVQSFFRRGEDAAGNGSHFHIALVVLPGSAPVFGVFRVGTGGKTLAVDFFKLRVRATAHPKRVPVPTAGG